MKVNNIIKHPTDKATIGGVVGWVSVAEGQLVLIEHKSIEKQGKPVWLNGFWNFLPIIISLTEKIELGDKILFRDEIFSATSDYKSSDSIRQKVLVLPENFSPEQLQMIVDGKLKHGDKILVECEDKGYEVDMEGVGGEDVGWMSQYLIKLNTSGHSTLYKVEERTYTQQEVDELLDQQAAKTTAQMLEKQKDMYSEREFDIAYCVGLLNRKLTIDELSVVLNTGSLPEKIRNLKQAIKRGEFDPIDHGD